MKARERRPPRGPDSHTQHLRLPSYNTFSVIKISRPDALPPPKTASGLAGSRAAAAESGPGLASAARTTAAVRAPDAGPVMPPRGWRRCVGDGVIRQKSAASPDSRSVDLSHRPGGRLSPSECPLPSQRRRRQRPSFGEWWQRQRATGSPSPSANTNGGGAARYAAANPGAPPEGWTSAAPRGPRSPAPPRRAFSGRGATGREGQRGPGRPPPQPPSLPPPCCAASPPAAGARNNQPTPAPAPRV